MELCFEWSSVVTNEWSTCRVTLRHESEAQNTLMVASQYVYQYPTRALRTPPPPEKNPEFAWFPRASFSGQKKQISRIIRENDTPVISLFWWKNPLLLSSLSSLVCTRSDVTSRNSIFITVNFSEDVAYTSAPKFGVCILFFNLFLLLASVRYSFFFSALPRGPGSWSHLITIDVETGILDVPLNGAAS